MNSKRVPKKSVEKVGGVPLVDRVIRLLDAVPEIDRTYLYCSDSSIINYLSPGGYTYVQRPKSLDADRATFNDILDKFLSFNFDLLKFHNFKDATHLVFVCCTSPFLKPETISDMIQKIQNKWFDSAFTATEHKTFAWYKLNPLNYSLETPTPQTQTLVPVFLETSSVYIFSIKDYLKNKRRIGSNPYIKVVDVFEGWDIDTPEDMRIAKKIAELE